MNTSRLDDMEARAVNRFADAVFIQAGACNPSGVARALVRAINACLDEKMDTNTVRADPAVRLICHQLAFLLGVPEIDDAPLVYCHLLDYCEAHQATPQTGSPT